MADIKKLTMKVVIDTSDFSKLSRESKKLASEIEGTGKRGTSTFSQFSRSLDTIQKRLSSIILSTIKWGAVITSAFAAISFGLLLREGVRFNQIIETSRIGIAAVVSSTQELVTAQGRTLQGAERFNAALGLSEGIQRRLQIANLQTAATYEQLLLTAQAIIPAAAGQGIELEKSLELTTALVQATSGIGLNMNQAVSEARSLLEGSINPMTDQLANALGITAATVKEWQKQGTLADNLLAKLEDFVRAGKLTQESFAGITSNLKDAVAIAAGQAFEGTFNQIKRIGQELTDAIISFTDKTFEVNPALAKIGKVIDDEIVRALEAAKTSAEQFVKFFDADTLQSALEGTRRQISIIFESIGNLFITFGQIPELAQWGLIGFLIFGKRGALVLPLLARELENVNMLLERMNETPLDELNRKIGALEGQIKAQEDALREMAKRADEFNFIEQRGYDQILKTVGLWKAELEELRIKREAILALNGEETTTGEQNLSIWETIGSAIVSMVRNLENAKGPAADVGNFFADMADNSFLTAFGITSVLQGVKDLQERAAQIRKALLVIPRGGGGGGDSDAKKAARERERIEEQLRDSINKIVLDREDYERFQIQETVEKARKAGVDKVLIAEFQAAKELEIEREKYKEFQDLLDRRTEEQIKRNEEILDAFNNIRVANLPESLKLSEQLESDLDDIQKALDTQNTTFEEAERERLLTVERYAELIADARKLEYIQSLKDSDSFFDQLKGGFLEFALAVESNGELAAQFFADTLSQMSQNFSDFFYNVLTGKFDDLVDVAKNAFRAILRAFLDMVAAIATRQIIVNIAGSFGFDTKGAKGAGGALGLGKDVLGLAGGAVGLGGAGASAAAGAGLLAGGTGLATASTGLPSFLLGTAGGGALAQGAGGLGLLGTIGAAAPYVGAVLAAAALAYSIIGPLLKKTPHLDIDFDSVKTDMGRRAAVVEEFLDPDFFLDNIGQVSVKRKAGLGLGGDEKILELIQQRIQETVEGIQDIIRRLPAELFNSLNETLLNAEIDIDTVIGGERLLEFDAKGKKIAEKFQAFIEGELPAKFFAAIRDSFFDPAFQALGVSAEGTQQLIDDFMAKLEAAGSREERAIIGQEFIDTFSAFVDAFNIVSGNANDAIGQTMNTIKGLANQLGFEAVPSIEQLRMKLGELIENAELDPETVQMYADLRNAIVALTVEVVNSISGLIGKMQSLNQTMASLGLATVDMSGYLSQAATQIQSFLQNNQGELSLSEQEAFLDQLTGIANAMLQEEMAAFNAEQERLRAEAQAAYEAQRAQIQGRIDGLNREKEAINETFRTRIDALNEELKLAQDFAAATESIRNTLDGIIFSQQSIFTSVERVNMLQGNIADLQNQLANTDDPNRQLDLIGSLEDAFKTLFDTAGEAFGVNSPEFVSIFDQVTGGLSDLANMTENRGRSAEEIQAEIERLTAENGARLAAIDASIQAAQAQLSSLQQQTVDNTFVASQELQDLFAYIQSEYQRLLDERFAQLGEISEFGFQTETEGLGVIAGFIEENLVTLKEQTGYVEQQLMHLEHNTELLETIANHVSGAPGFAGGSGGLKDFGDRTLAFLHGQEAVLTKAQYLSIMGSMEAAISLQKNFGNVLQSFTGAMSGIGLLNKFANEIQGGTNLSNLTQKLTKGGYISSLAGELPRTPEQGNGGEVVKEGDIHINLSPSFTIHSSSPNADKVLPGMIEGVIAESLKRGRLRGAVQEVAKKRLK